MTGGGRGVLSARLGRRSPHAPRRLAPGTDRPAPSDEPQHSGPSSRADRAPAVPTSGHHVAPGPLVQAWSDGTSTPPTVELRAHDESASGAGKIFTSSEGGSSGQPGPV